MFNKFVFICLISLLVITNQATCEGIPDKKEDCFTRDVSKGYHCCYIQPSLYYAFEKKCIEIEDYGEQREFIDEYGERWLVECDDKIEYKIEKGKRCGLNKPQNPVDCWSYSTESKSCCFYNNTLENGTITHHCGWYKKKQGVIKDNDKYFNKAILNCSSLFYEVNLGLLLFIFVLFLL